MSHCHKIQEDHDMDKNRISGGARTSAAPRTSAALRAALAIITALAMLTAMLPLTNAAYAAASGKTYHYWCGGDSDYKVKTPDYYTDLGIIMWKSDKLLAEGHNTDTMENGVHYRGYYMGFNISGYDKYTSVSATDPDTGKEYKTTDPDGREYAPVTSLTMTDGEPVYVHLDDPDIYDDLKQDEAPITYHYEYITTNLMMEPLGSDHYDLDYELAGGEWSGSADHPKTVAVPKEDATVKLAVPVRSGYVFAGWQYEFYEGSWGGAAFDVNYDDDNMPYLYLYGLGESISKVWDEAKYSVDHGIKLTATWEPDTRSENPMTASGKTATVKYSKAKKSSQTITKAKAFKIKDAEGKLSFEKKSGNSKITVSKAGKITVKKGIKKKTYKVKVYVTASGNDYFRPKTKTVTVTIKVK